ncbi:histidine kinase [Natronococcus pandeyae]|uniref:histidine kinase n=2 Tax=Natronococcus pandeyae TaxID=2055836 RepID=A0A8J8Q1M9_9EURY|nr:histidine kinase [Natronococcus pandeyae]
MTRWNRVFSIPGSRRVVLALGGLYIALAAGWIFRQASLGTSVATILIVSSFIGGSGIILFGGGYRLPETDIHPTCYPAVAGRCLTGFGVMIGILTLYHLQPDTGITNPERSLPILTGFSSVAGFGVGIYDARAKTRARELKLQNRKLQRTEERLKESNERLEQFAYAASHDLQEPLRMVSSYLQLIESRYADEFDEDGEEFLEYAIDGSERMKEMIDGLLEYSRVETQGEAFEPIDLDEILADACQNLEIQIDERDAVIDSEELPRVEGDASQLRQVFQNLISNAIEYSGDAPPQVDISAERDGEEWIISVRDSGLGIPPEEQDRIFEVFERLHSHEESSGTGIGLALCNRIIERHNGEIWVESDPGEGTTFSFTLPASSKQTETTAAMGESVSTE